MKPIKTIRSLVLLVVLAAGAVSCQKEELPATGGDAPQGAPLTIHVVDGGYTASNPQSSPATRAVENGYITQFTAGDKIGLYVVKPDGSYAQENVALTLTDNGSGTLAWTPPTGTTLYYEGGTVKYFAYYPYQSSLTGTPTPSADDAAGFFANIVSKWTPAADQSTYASYAAQDLMVGSGTVSKSGDAYTLALTMTHAMALVVIETPMTKYTLTDKDGSPLPDYAPAPGTKFYGFTPYSPTTGIYRYLVKPDHSEAANLIGSYTATDGTTKEYALPQNNITAANYVHYKVDGATVTTKSHTLQAGDFYLKDGSLVAHNASLSDAQKAACIGIVYWVGDATQKDATLAKDHPGCTHGLVVSLGGNTQFAWGDTIVSVQNWLNSNKNGEFLSVATGVEPGDPLNNIQGYNNTKAIEAFNADVANSGNLVTPVQKAVDYRTTVPAPSTSSDWYLPSEKELTLLCGTDVDDIWMNNSGSGGGATANRDLINGKLSSISGTLLLESNYWSSSESINGPAFYVAFNNGLVIESSKDGSFRVRFTLAF